MNLNLKWKSRKWKSDLWKTVPCNIAPWESALGKIVSHTIAWKIALLKIVPRTILPWKIALWKIVSPTIAPWKSGPLGPRQTRNPEWGFSPCDRISTIALCLLTFHQFSAAQTPNPAAPDTRPKADIIF